MISQQLDFLTLFQVDATDRDQLLNLITDYLMADGYVQESFRQALFEREQKYPTGLPGASFGVAIPHVDVEHVKKNAILTVTLTHPVTFHLMGGTPEDTVEVESLFVILLCERTDHLKLLVRFMKVIQNPQDMMTLRQTQSQPLVAEILTRYIEQQ